jgi:hypothetical protein
LVPELVVGNLYSYAVKQLVLLPRLSRFRALLWCVPHLGSFGEEVRATAKFVAPTPEEAAATLVALDAAEQVEAECATADAMMAALTAHWKVGGGDPVPTPAPEPPPFVEGMLEAVAAAEGEQALAERFTAIREGASHAAELRTRADVSEAEADALVAAVQNAALVVGGAAADAVTDTEAAARAWKRSAEGDGRSGVWLTVRVPTELAARVNAAVDLLPPATAPASGWSRSAAIREALAAGLDVLERRAKRRGER